MRNIFILLFVLGFSFEPVLAADSLTMGVAIDKAGRQRMLTQRMMKAYAISGLKLKPGAFYEIKDAADLFSAQLAELSVFASGSAEKQQIEKIRLLWNELKDDILDEPSLNKAIELNDLAELLLQESHRFVGMLETRSGTVAGKLVNLSGRQRMLSQRIAKLYLLETWGLGASSLKTQYADASSQFGVALERLMAAKINTAKIDRGLKKVQKNWRIFGISNFSAKHNVRVPALVVRSMDKILRQMNEITGLYAQLK